MHTLTVAINGPANSGTVSSGYAPTSKRQLNKAYSILATLKTEFVFDGWTINDMAGAGVSAAQAELPTLSFTMRKGLVLVAKFITNPFNSAVTGSSADSSRLHPLRFQAIPPQRRTTPLLVYAMPRSRAQARYRASYSSMV